MNGSYAGKEREEEWFIGNGNNLWEDYSHVKDYSLFKELK